MPTMKLTIEVHPDLHAQLKEHCARTRVSMKDFLTEALVARLRMQGQVVPLHQEAEEHAAQRNPRNIESGYSCLQMSLRPSPPLDGAVSGR